MRKTFFLFSLFLGVAALLAAQEINTDSSSVTIIAFHGDGSDVKGEIRGMEGSVQFDPANPAEGKFSVCIDASTFKTDNGMRNWHIKSPSYLKVRKFPSICFESTEITATENGFETSGMLTIKESTREVVISFTYEDGILKGRTEINRHDFAVGGDNEERVAPVIQADIYCVLDL